MKRKVWVLGSSNVDITYNVEKMPAKGYTVEAWRCTRATGGKGANQAVAAAHWGAAVSFIGAIGKDADGKILLEVFQTHRIDSRYVTVEDGIPSGNAIIFVDDSGANSITVFPGANRYVKLDSSVPFEKDDILAAQLEVNMDAVEFYFQLAKKQGAYTILNPSPIKSLSKTLLENTDMLVLNEVEAREISGIEIDGTEAAVRFAGGMLAAGMKAVVLTLGKNGALAADNKGHSYIPGYPVKVVDTQGAGDAFLGTLAAQLAFGGNLSEAAAFANTAASLSVTKSGSTQVSMPSWKELEVSDTTRR